MHLQVRRRGLGPGPALTARRLGILGGTFNPPHLAHLVCAQEAFVQLELDRVLLVPAAIPPHKAVEEEPGPGHRLELCRRAVEGDPRFDVCDLEISRGGSSYTVDTLEELRSQTPDSELFLVVGGDMAATLPQWRDPERILALARLAVAQRKGTSRTAIESALATLPGGERTMFFDMPTVAFSSTDVRERVRDGKPVRYIVPDAVESYIHQEDLYTRAEAH